MFMPPAKHPRHSLSVPESLAGAVSRRREKYPSDPIPSDGQAVSTVHRPEPPRWVAGWTIRPIDDLFRRTEGGDLAKRPGFGGAEL